MDDESEHHEVSMASIQFNDDSLNEKTGKEDCAPQDASVSKCLEEKRDRAWVMSENC